MSDDQIAMITNVEFSCAFILVPDELPVLSLSYLDESVEPFTGCLACLACLAYGTSRRRLPCALIPFMDSAEEPQSNSKSSQHNSVVEVGNGVLLIQSSDRLQPDKYLHLNKGVVLEKLILDNIKPLQAILFITH